MIRKLTDWRVEVEKIPAGSESGGRLALYRKFKIEPSPEAYLCKMIPRDRRRTICQLRCGCLPLQIELGRYRYPKIPLHERICELCNSETEDETHFLVNCTALSPKRQELFQEMSKIVGPCFHSLTPRDKACTIVDISGNNLGVGKAIHSMFKFRKSLICS